MHHKLAILLLCTMFLHTDSNVREGTTTFTGSCFSDDQCQNNQQDMSFTDGINQCCGTGYYKLTTDGDCLPCNKICSYFTVALVIARII